MKYRFIIYIVLLITIIISCKKIDISYPQPVNGINIYIAGNKEENGTPFIIKNGELMLIEMAGLPANKIRLNDFDVSNGKMYATFKFLEQSKQGHLGAYMVDNEVKFVDQKFSGQLNSIKIHRNDLYIAGLTDNRFVLKNGKLFKTFNHSHFNYFNIIENDYYFYSNNDTYYYKNNEQIDFENKEEFNWLKSFNVIDRDIYLTGGVIIDSAEQQFHKAAYWKNGIIHYLPNSKRVHEALNMAIDNKDIYVITGEADYYTGGSFTSMQYFKNGKIVKLPAPKYDYNYKNFKIYNGDIYILVTEFTSADLIAKVFKNDRLIASYPIPHFYFYQYLKLGISNK